MPNYFASYLQGKAARQQEQLNAQRMQANEFEMQRAPIVAQQQDARAAQQLAASQMEIDGAKKAAEQQAGLRLLSGVKAGVKAGKKATEVFAMLPPQTKQAMGITPELEQQYGTLFDSDPSMVDAAIAMMQGDPAAARRLQRGIAMVNQQGTPGVLQLFDDGSTEFVEGYREAPKPQAPRDPLDDEYKRAQIDAARALAAQRNAKTESEGGGNVEPLRAIVNDMRSRYRRLDEMGAIVNPRRGMVDNLKAAAASSATWQAVEGAVGSEAQSLRQQIINMRPQVLLAVQQATGLASQQLNSNQELQTYLSTLSDPSKDIDSAMQALDMIERTYLNGAPAAASPGGAAPTADDAAAAKVQKWGRDANGRPVRLP